jgi:hypothetical protein
MIMFSRNCVCKNMIANRIAMRHPSKNITCHVTVECHLVSQKSNFKRVEISYIDDC